MFPKNSLILKKNIHYEIPIDNFFDEQTKTSSEKYMKVQELYANLRCKLTSAYNVDQYRINMAKIDRAMSF